MNSAVKNPGTRRTLLSIAMIALAAAGCGGDATGAGGGNNNPVVNVGLSSKANLGSYLVSADGRTLYIFALDVPGTEGHAAVSNCTGGCLPIWPIFHVDAPVVAAGLNASDFGEILRTDGVKQSTYKGWPLYLFAGDRTAGDTTGDDLGDPRPTDLWFAIKNPFYSVVELTKNGGPALYLADPAGRALYIDANDTVGTASSDPVPACNGACLTNWPVFLAGSGSLPTGLGASRLTSFTRADGARQSALDGHPLYFFAGDSAPGDTRGHAANAVFDTVDPTAL